MQDMEIEKSSSYQGYDPHKTSAPHNPVPFPTPTVSNGTVDIRGRIADKRRTGGLKASSFVVVNEMAERMAFYSVAVNMVTYLVEVMRQPLPDAVTHFTNWVGAVFILTILGAFLADAYLGRFLTILTFSCIYSLGMALLTISGTVDSLHPPPCLAKPCEPASTKQTAFLYCALALMAIGTGGIKPCVSSFGADQFDEADEKEKVKKYSFFNWFFLAINMGVLLGLTLMVYVQVKAGWGWGFGAPTIAVVTSIVILLAGVPFYRYQKPMGSAFTRFAQVLVAACRNHFRGVEKREVLYEVTTQESDIIGAKKLAHTLQFGFLDKAAIITDPNEVATNRWRLCTVTQVEEFKCFIRVLPVWASTIAIYISFAQLSSFFVSQAKTMDLKLGPHFNIPPSSVPIFAAIDVVVIVPIYEGVLVPLLRRYTGHHRGLTSLQRMGVGLFISIFALISAAVVEKKRRNSMDPRSMSVFWLFPQYFLIGSAEVFTYVGQLEFFYDEASDGTRSLSSAMFLSEIGIGSWLATALVKIVVSATGGEKKGWLRNDLNRSRLDYFYWILCGINAVNFLCYLVAAWTYNRGSGTVGSDRDEAGMSGKKRHEEMSIVQQEPLV